MPFKFTINDHQFRIDETAKGFRWMPSNGSGRLFPTLWEAQKDALLVMQLRCEEENANG